jgi:hypothetical protein
MASLRVALGFAQLPDSELSDFSGSVVLKMQGNPGYITPVVPLGDITAARTAFDTAIIAAAQGGTELTAIKRAARAALVVLLRTQAAYVQSIAGDDQALLLSSGFWNTSTERVRKPLPKPSILSIDNFATTQLLAKATPLDNARAYEARFRVGAQPWQNAGVFTKARGILLSNLIPGSMCDVQVRGVGGSLGYSDWSDPVSHMAT